LRPLLVYLIVVLILAVAFSIACTSDDGDDSAIPPPPDAAAIRDVDFAKLPDVQATLSRLSGAGALDAASVLYADLSGDRREEAVLPIASGGSAGNLAYLVYTPRPSGEGPALVLSRIADRTTAGGLRMEVVEGKLVETVGEYGLEDPLCCPSILRKTTFRWDGKQLQVEREEKLPNPGAQHKE